eukprot:3066201-Prymnesium_polylepis.1
MPHGTNSDANSEAVCNAFQQLRTCHHPEALGFCGEKQEYDNPPGMHGASRHRSPLSASWRAPSPP